jgi:hypothetical protein
MQEVGFGSNYVLSTSNILVPRIMSEVGFGSNYVLSTSNILVPRIMSEVGFGSNYTTRINSQLTTAIAATQPKIISTAGQIIIGNGDGITTTSTGLTWTTDTLNATNLTTTNTITTPNLAVSTQATITQLLTSGNGTLGTDMFSLVNNATNSLRFAQVWIGANDQKWLLIQKTNNVDNTIFNFRNGNIAVGTFSNPAYRIDLVGDINITGNYRVNSTIYKPANAVLADSATTATKLATGRNIAGVLFDGTGDIAIDYFSLNSKPIILQPTTTNLQLVSGYTLSVPGNVGVGTTSIATNILQVGAGGRLRISNGTTDYSLIGTIDTDGATNTSILISGTTRIGNAGNIQYFATTAGGSHIFYVAATTRMTISSAGVNIPDNLGITGRVGIGTAPHATYKLDVLGDINVSGAFRIGGVALANSWSASGTDIYYTAGKVSIGGTTALDAKLTIRGINGAIGLDMSTDDQYAEMRVIRNSRFSVDKNMYIGYGGGVNSILYFFSNGSADTMRLQSGNVNVNNDLSVGGTSYLRNTYIYSGGEGSGIALYFGTPFTGLSALKSAIIAEPISSYSRHHLAFCLNTAANNSTNASSSDVCIRLHTDGYIQFLRQSRWANDTWNKCVNGNDRLYFAPNATTYIKGGPSYTSSIVFRNSSDADMAYFFNNLLYCYGPVNLSDRRIKRDIVEINDETALNMILQVQPTTYYYRDEARNRGNGKVYGFIAQQIKEVIPDAVHTTQEIIANIYKTCLVYNKREIYHSIPQDVAIDTDVHILDKEGGDNGKRCKIKEIYDDYFVIDEDIEGDDCFVFGYMVNDLNGIDKSYIYTLNVCATQELHRKIEAQKVIIQSQDDRIKSQEERIKDLETKMSQILNNMSL